MLFGLQYSIMHFHIRLQFVNFMDIEMRIYMKIDCTEFVSSAMILGFYGDWLFFDYSMVLY